MSRHARQMSIGTLQQAGAVPYRLRDGNRVEILLITNKHGEWIVPKGCIEPGSTAEETALTEAMEEAGVLAIEAGAELGEYEYEKAGRRARVRLFAVRVARAMNAWPEQHKRSREWVSLDEACRRVNLAEVVEAMGKLSSAQRRRAS